MVAAVVVALLVVPGSFMNPVQPVDTNQRIADAEKQNAPMMAETMMKRAEESPDPDKTALNFGYTDRESERFDIGRGSQSASMALPEGDSTAGDIAVFRPSYLPPDYHLLRVESDVDNNISIHYGDDRGGYICLKTLPGLQEDVLTVAGRGGNDSRVANELKKEVADQSDPTVIRWTSEHEGTPYRFELTGSLPPEELAQVAASVK